jgi:two-component system sensor histidine kinase CpxA
MKSLSLRLLVSLVASLGVGAGLLVIWGQWAFRTQGPELFHQDAMRFMADQAEQKWIEQGPEGMRRYLESLHRNFRGEFRWFDQAGKDLMGRGGDPDLVRRFHEEMASRSDDPMPPPPIRKRPPERPGPDRPALPKPSRYMPQPKARNSPPIRMGDDRVAFVTPSPSGRFILVEYLQGPSLNVPFTLFGGALAILSFFGVLVSRQVTHPIRDLRSVVERFGQGDLSVRCASDRRDEIGSLARTFDRMADQITGIVERERAMVRNVAHEVRGPLTRIGLLCERIRGGRNVPDTLDRLENEITALSRIPDTLLHLTMVENGRAPIDRTAIDLAQFLERIVHRYDPTAAQRGLTIALEIDASVANAAPNTDAALLERSLENVLENAIRHSPVGTNVELRAQSRGDTMELSVRDRGPGVAESDIEAIFRPFFRTDASRNRHTGGVGLGLAIARAGIEALGGQIRAENAEPGLRVVLSLPITA